MATSPTTLSLKLMREEGYLCAIVEKWNPHAKIRQDLYGFIDILGIKEGETLAVQCTTKNNAQARVVKIADHDNLPEVRKAEWKIEVHGWEKVKNRWTCKRIDLS